MHTVTYVLLHISPLLIYLLVGCVLLLESSGVPILNSTLLLFTGALASLGHLQAGYLALAAVTGSVSGACLAYYIGRCGGQQILFRLAQILRIGTEKVDIVERWFRRSRAWMIFFSRMLPYVRPFACFPAGIAQMNFVRFFCCALLGSLIWCVTLLVIGWNLGKRWELAVPVIQQYTVPVLGFAVVLIGLYIVSRHLIKHFLHTHLKASTDDVAHDTNKRSRDLVEV